jgi:aryl-alcohol dehydrogenase-like predicted oxidoreductase
MKYITIPGSGLRFSKLAFGCAPVLGRVGKRNALRAMEFAFDKGVSHFDVARSYGFGEAEAVLGAFAADKRYRITIATKFGIRATPVARPLRLVKPIVRQIARRVPAIRSLVRKASSQTLASGYYSLRDARKSFDESLRQIGTDYVDCLLVHDCSPTDQLSDELLAYLNGLVTAGKVRVWGFATRREWIDAVCEQAPERPMIIQCEQNLLNRRPIMQGRLLGTPAIFHSPFGGPKAVRELETILAREQQGRITKNVSGDLANASLSSRLLLEVALQLAADNPVLCSMFDPTHILDNAAAVDNPAFTTEQISGILRHFGQT